MPLVLVKPGTKIDFAGKRYIAYGISICLILIGLFSCIFGSGLKLGIDFAGGVIIQVQFASPVEDEDGVYLGFVSRSKIFGEYRKLLVNFSDE